MPENSPALIAHLIILDGQIIGGWKRTLKKEAVQVKLALIIDLTKAQEHALASAASLYGEFLQLPVERV